jgi:hypothetical protein
MIINGGYALDKKTMTRLRQDLQRFRVFLEGNGAVCASRGKKAKS